MQKGMQFLNKEVEKEEVVCRCPVCGINGGNGALCDNHRIKVTDYEWVRDYINNLDKVNDTAIYILDSAISERQSLIINNVPIINGKLLVKECLEDGCSKYMERILTEILSLEEARSAVIEFIRKDE